MPLRPPLPHIDPAPLRDMARSLRFVAERGSRTLQKSLPLDALPDPAARMADAALSTVLRVGQGAERSVSAFAHALLDDDAAPPPLGNPEAAKAEAHFARAVQGGLRQALTHLGAESTLVSEMAARRAWAEVTRSGTGQSDSETAAALFAALHDAHTVREVVWPDDLALSPSEATQIASFALLLAMLADPAGLRALIAPCVDLALALRADLAAATTPAALTALFDEFRDHV
jgi:hypothetical protein